MFYGYQIIKSASRNPVDILNLYEFDSEAEREFWIQSDLSSFFFSVDLFELQTRSEYKRKKLCYEDAQQLIKLGKNPVHLATAMPEKLFSLTHLSGHFLSIKPESNALERTFASSFISSNQSMGIVLRFDKRSDRRRFVASHKNLFGNVFSPLKKSDPCVTAAAANGLVISHDSYDPNFAGYIHYVLTNYSKVDPARNFLSLIAFEDWSHPQIFSFEKKSSRDLFISLIKGIKTSPLRVHTISNFNPIAILSAKRKNLFKGSLSQSLELFCSKFSNSQAGSSEFAVFESANSALCSIESVTDLSHYCY